MRLLTRVLGFGEPRLILRRDSGLAAGHGADHQCFWIDGGPAGEVGSDSCLDQVDCGGVQVANTESISSQCRDVSAGVVGPLFPHGESVSPSVRGSIPRILGSSGIKLGVGAMATRQSSATNERVWSQLPDGSRAVLEDELSPTDLQSLLINLAQTRARRIGTAEVLR